jgi:NADH-quinone oxidoreductase subunit E
MSAVSQQQGAVGLSGETEALIKAEVARYPEGRTALLPALKIAQCELHYLPPEAIARVADLVGVSHAAANELATFYSMLHKAPLGTTTVEVCAQLPCALRGADELLDELATLLGIAPGETTANGAVTLKRTHECFGACHRAPMCLVNHEYRENLRGEAREALVRELKALAG